MHCMAHNLGILKTLPLNPVGPVFSYNTAVQSYTATTGGTAQDQGVQCYGVLYALVNSAN